jgi:hypothetical protein
LRGLAGLAEAKVMAMANSDERLQAWASAAVRRVVVQALLAAASEYKAEALRLARRWVR